MKHAHPGDLPTYSDRKAERNIHAPLAIEDIVRIQQLGCAGRRPDEIVAETGLSIEDVRRVLDPEPVERRQERAGLGYPELKR